jgi:UDP-xylose:glucoside alpha-1,3-xylosyltransferase
VQESENKNTGWYPRFAQHEFYGEFGVNSGVMLMHLKKMREIGWEKSLIPIYQKYSLKVVFGDQDLINIYFWYNPNQLFIMPCEFNYRPDHCMYTSLCNVENGVKVIHGSRGSFHKIDQPVFSTIYDSIQKVLFLETNDFFDKTE